MTRTGMLAVGVLGAAACGGEAREEEDLAPAGPSISITAPAGPSVAGGSFVVQLAAHGVDVVPAGIEQMNSGHHHLFINRDPTPVGETIPAGEGIVHLGAAQTEYTFNGLAPGVYTITAVLGDHLHVRIAEIAPARLTVTVN